MVESLIKTYLEGDFSVYLSGLRPNLMRHDRGAPVIFSYQMKEDGKAVSQREITSETVKISETSNFANSREIFFAKNSNSVDVYNLKTGQQYYYQITIALKNGENFTEEGELQTADSVRFLNMPFSVNVRDLGGWETQDCKGYVCGI